MTENVGRYKEVLKEEKSILEEVLSAQQFVRKAINDKDWTGLMKFMSEVNILMDRFNRLDEERASLAENMGADDSESSVLLTEVRGLLVKCRAENKALSDYINITRNFVKGIIDNALPQSKAKVYSRNGNIVQNQPHSVVLNALL
ncbi:MAG: flagellar export chaperone FlgN [Treponema sp.]|nr:flagellar export chaperone FlgN [Treponema sp.]